MQLRGILSVAAVVCAAAALPCRAGETVVWSVDGTAAIGGRAVECLGKPAVRETDRGKAVHFDGVADALVVPANPIQSWTQFTVEVLLRPEAGGPAEQRLLHVQEDGTENRLLVETRLTPEGRWFLDTFLKSGESRRTLATAAALHPAGEWHWVALVYDGAEMRHFVDAEQEGAGPVTFAALGPGRTSIGARLNRVSWFKGEIGEIRFHPRALPAAELQRVTAPQPPKR